MAQGSEYVNDVIYSQSYVRLSCTGMINFAEQLNLY